MTKKPCLTVITGFALCGKTSLARRLSTELGCFHQDIDKLQIGVFGWEGHPKPDPSLIDLSPLLRPLRKVHRASTAMLISMAETFLEEGESLVVSALSLVFPENQERLAEIVSKNDAKFRQILCHLPEVTREEIERRIAADQFGVGFNVRLATTYEQYLFGLKQFPTPSLPYLAVDMTKPFEKCVVEALHYIHSE